MRSGLAHRLYMPCAVVMVGFVEVALDSLSGSLTATYLLTYASVVSLS